MKKSLSKKVTEILFLTSIGVVAYTATDSVTVYAQNVDKNIRLETTIKENDKGKLNTILNITKTEYGKFYSEDSEYRVHYANKKYEKCINEISVNGQKYSSEKDEYNFHYYGMSLNPIAFKQDKNKVVIKANGYNDIELIIQKDGKLLSYKEIESKAPKLDVGNNIKVEKGTPIDLNAEVSATDKKDGDLKAKIQVKVGNLNVTNPNVGIYKIIYSVTNSLGKTTTAIREVEVIEKQNTSPNSSVNEKQESIKIKNKIADGVYTLGFKSYRLDNPEQESMLGGFFDENIKVTVKDGKITFEMLNIMNADLLYDFRMESKNKYSESKSKWVGEADAQGLYFMQTFEFPIEDLLSEHTACVLVSAMGGKKGDIGNVDKYTKAKFVFDKNLKKGWNGFEALKNQKTSETILNDALKSAGLDRNRDGKVTDDELKTARGEVSLSDNKIKDISRLKNLGSEVTRLSLNGNKINKLPEGVFDNLINLEKLYLNGNKISDLPKGIFDKLSNLKTLGLSTNMIKKLPKGIFDNLVNLEELQLSSNEIIEIEDGVFDNLVNLKSIGLSNNKIIKIQNNVFKKMKNLNNIFLYNNKLEDIPNSIGELKNLKSLKINNNNILYIPKELSNLENLNELDLHTNFIKEFPKEIYGKLKKLTNLDVSDNQLSEIPNDINKIFPNANNLDFSMNKIKHISNLEKNTFKAFPQKNAMNLNLKAENGEIKWKQELSTLDMIYWAFFGKDKLKTLEEYKKSLNNDMKAKIQKKSFDWDIITEIQKKNQNGKYETIKKIMNSNEKDKNNDVVYDSEMKKDSEYRIIKRVFLNQGIIEINIFNDMTTAKASSDAKKNEENLKVKNKIYDIKVKILKENEDAPSMAANYIKKVTYEIKNGKHYIIAKLNRSDWMSDIKATVDGKEVLPEKLNKEKNSNNEETSDIKFEVKDLNSKIALGMNVQPMGNARVLFRIVPKEESLNIVKNDEAKEQDNIKDISEIKNIDENKKGENKESYEKSQAEIESLNKEVEKKKEELQKLNHKIQKANEKKNDKDNNAKSLKEVIIENNIDNESQYYKNNIQSKENIEQGQPVKFLSHKVDMNAFSARENSNGRSEQTTENGTSFDSDGFQSLASLIASGGSKQSSQYTSNNGEESTNENDEYSELADADSVELEDLGDQKKEEPKVEETKAEKIATDKKSPINFKVLGIIGASVLGLGALVYGLTLKFKNKIRRGDNK